MGHDNNSYNFQPVDPARIFYPKCVKKRGENNESDDRRECESEKGNDPSNDATPHNAKADPDLTACRPG
jgi:hypothetical protein